MKYCAYCGKELFDEAVICSGCGCPTDLYRKQNAQNNQSQQQTVNQTAPTQQITTNIYAILSLIFAFLSPIIGIVFGAIGVKDIQKHPNQKGEGLAKAGLGLSIAFLVLSILVAIILIVIFAVLVSNGEIQQPNNPNEIGINFLF